MSTWSEAPARSRVLRGGAATGARAARIDSDLRTTPFASAHVVDARLTDPHLQDVVDRATRLATEQGHAEGHAAGYAEGLARAAAEARLLAAERARELEQAESARDAALQSALLLLQQATRELSAREAVAVQEVQAAVVELALDLARVVLDREVAVAADPGAEALARALALAPEGTPVTARLNPRDVELLGDVPSLLAGRELSIVPDGGVERGGCVVDTVGRRIDTQLGPALDRAAAVLR